MEIPFLLCTSVLCGCLSTLELDEYTFEGGRTLRDAIVGRWATEVSSSVALIHSFNEDGSFEMQLVYSYPDRSESEVEVHSGIFELRDGVTGVASDEGDFLFAAITRSSCVDGPRVYGGTIQVLSGSLLLSTSLSAWELRPALASREVSASITFGCFAADGAFEPSAVSDL